MKKRIVLVAVVVAGAAAVAGLVVWLRNPSEPFVKISGNIEMTQVAVSFKVAGKLIERRVDEGAPVTKGMLLARLDPEQIVRQKTREQASQASAESALVQLTTAIELQKAQLAADTEMRRAEIRQAQTMLAELLAGSRKQEIRQARAALEEARTQHKLAVEDWDRAQRLYKNEDISTAQRDQYRTQLDRTAAAARQLEQRLALVVEGPRKEEIESARAQLERAQAALKLTETARLEVTRKQQELSMRRAEIDRARAQVSVVDSQLDDTVVYAPVDGVVLVKSAEPGEVLAAGTSVVTVGDIDHPWVRGYIHETDLGRVKLGAHARVTTDSFPGKIYDGRISFISSEAEFTPKQIQTQEERVKLVYRVKVEVANPRRELKSNMPVVAEILLDAK
jgi:HlyD family secretion protein